MNATNIVVMLIENQEAFEGFKQTLANFSWQNPYGLLCITNDKDLYLPIREYLDSLMLLGEKETLVIYEQKSFLTFNDVKQYINHATNLILWDSRIPISSTGIRTLMEAYTIHFSAGLITGRGNTNEEICFNIDDIYAKEVSASGIKDTKDRFIDIDTLTKGTLITKYYGLFIDFDFDNHSIYEYGIELRKLGYKNYYDKEVK